ncbi:hypothetical protein FUT69_06845 [Xylella taiwanensis]|uniref:Uncharacterized protein n=1 Tax=Xylella taiwanensis TaxID=1444770 RepID=Z9JIT3_9GAMM|nr:hypothetical protein [Xylella taiwanensis]EWS77746.1 hypothetical protein AF72_09430 [Xylella taiwanensis]MCD8457411.1 hypothetical protein [Xylella taiwanensis]MCD8457569.1 hypothetical protein [Xylella taiwanensis]MCD8461307.1 hypothetical protein [Xylella taiwanensis]MCD8462659.1 hypothetical protein [Xylella taiwanensis]
MFINVYCTPVNFAWTNVAFPVDLVLTMLIDRPVLNPYQSMSTDDPRFNDNNRALTSSHSSC